MTPITAMIISPSEPGAIYLDRLLSVRRSRDGLSPVASTGGGPDSLLDARWLARRGSDAGAWLARRGSDAGAWLARRGSDAGAWLARRWSDAGAWLARRWSDAGALRGPDSACWLASGLDFFPKHIGVNFGWGAHSLSPTRYPPALLFGVCESRRLYADE